MLTKIIANTRSSFRQWTRDESGNVTFEWVLVVAGAVGMSIAVMASIGSGSQAFAQTAEVELSTMEIMTH